MTISQILQRNVDRLLFLTKREQEIRLDELDTLFHARTLDRIFVEERIYKRIETEKTEEGVKNTIIEGFKPFRAELRHDVTLEDVERLLKIPIRRISQFDINKNREDIEKVLAEEDEVRDNLAHLRAFTVKYLKGLISQYKKKYPRCTQISKGPFQQADVRKLTASELSVKIDKENHYIGTDLRGAEELFKCSSLDEILCVWKDGRFKKIQPPDKFFVDKDIMEIFLFQQEKDRDKEYT
jgi:topoisomerase-4 subunit A